jgi:hypothetical protein
LELSPSRRFGAFFFAKKELQTRPAAMLSASIPI